MPTCRVCLLACATQNERQSLPDYCRDNLLNKYGLPSMADGYVTRPCRAACSAASAPNTPTVYAYRAHASTRPMPRYLFALVRQVVRVGAKHSRFHTFGMLTGVIKAEQYNERAAHVYLALLSSLFPRFTASTMRRRKYVVAVALACAPGGGGRLAAGCDVCRRCVAQGRQPVRASRCVPRNGEAGVLQSTVQQEPQSRVSSPEYVHRAASCTLASMTVE